MKDHQHDLKIWLDQTLACAKDYLAGNFQKDTKVVNYAPPLELRDKSNLHLGPSRTLNQTWDILESVIQNSVRTTHPLFLNQLFGGIQPESISAEWISALLNPTMATYEVAPALTLIEKELIKELCKLIGFKLGEGIMATGGSNANLIGLLCARQFKVPDVKKYGYKGKNYVVYVSAEAHYSYEKAVHIAGLGIENLRSIRVDQKGKMDPNHLRECIQGDIDSGFTPMMIGATAGTTVFGAFDPLVEINKVAREFNLWLHVDAAWGGGAMFSKKHRSLLDGIHMADSVTFDAHKTLNTGLVTSFFLCKHPGTLKQTNQGGGSEYIFHDYDNSDWDMGTYSLQCGRRADALKLWLLWLSRGNEGLEEIINGHFELAEYAHRKITAHPRLKLVSFQYLNNCFQVIPPREGSDISQFTLKVRTHLVQSGVALVNYVQRPTGETFIRLVTANNQTTFNDMDKFFVELEKAIYSLDKVFSH